MIRLVAFLVAILIAVTTVVVAYSIITGLDARAHPGPIETRLARAVRSLAVPRAVRDRANPLEPSAEVLAEGMSHYADHCASCHANDGSGSTAQGRGLYPKAPDMRLAATQGLSDAELFYIIENGIRLTGMPAWGNGTPEGEQESWELVHFIRELPRLTAEDIKAMEAMNPRSLEEIRQEIEEERFLRGELP